MKNTIQNFALFIAATIFVLLIFEALSRVYFKQAYTHVVDECGALTSMQVDPGRAELGLRPHFRGRMRSGEFDVHIVLDSLGFRSPIIAGEKEDNRPFYITLLGDSFMFGWGVELQNSFAGQLARELNSRLKKKVIITNLAVPATGQAAQLKFLQKAPQSRPDVIILGMYICEHAASGNDLLDNLNDVYKNLSEHHRTFQPKQELGVVGPLRKARRFFKQRSNLYRFLEARIGSLVLAKFSGAMNVQKDEMGLRKAWQVTDSLLVEMNREAKNLGAIFVLQYCPNLLDVSQANNTVYERLKEFCRVNGIFIAANPISIFRNIDTDFSIRDFYFLVDGHWTERAHKTCAHNMAGFLLETCKCKQ